VVSAKLDVRIADGETGACEELPVTLEPGDGPLLAEPPRQWAEQVLAPKPCAVPER
jgi:hypothetical protein